MLRQGVIVGWLVLAASWGAFSWADEAGPRKLRIGMIDTLFEDRDDARVRGQIEPFARVVRQQAQRDGEFVMVKGVDAAASDMQADRLQMAVLHGWEYAWLQETCPDVEPLLVAVNDVTTQKAHVLVAKDCPAKDLMDLKGQTMAIARRMPNFIRFYLDRLSPTPEESRFKTLVERDTEAGIEAVIDGKAQVTVVSTSAWNVYQNRKPVRAQRLRVLQESTTFPPPCLVYQKGKVKQDVLERFRDAMLKAHEGTEGRQTLTLWRISSFQPVPVNYQELVDAIRKEYPRVAK